ncbi:MAG: hypothetical protein K8T25_18225 [Planctomycetia bacterium]|nr:hypothetical protein [Planctomycetia bacterium]
MQSAVWELQTSQVQSPNQAIASRFVLGSLRGELDLSRPEHGLRKIYFNQQSLAGAELLGVMLHADAADMAELPHDCYVREHDLIASYNERAGRPFSPQIYWRGLTAQSDESVGLELVAAVHTSRLDAHPQLTTETCVPGKEIWQLAEPEEFVLLERSDAAPLDCVLVRGVNPALSYVEMVHPLDAPHATLSIATQDGLVHLRRRLIHRWMEKGVLVRARVRGWFVNRIQDVDIAARLYREFSAAELPLTV